MRKRDYVIREVWNSYINCNMYQVVREGYCLLPPEQLGAYKTLAGAKAAIHKYKGAKGEVFRVKT